MNIRILVLALLSLVFLGSCSGVEKRIYRKGFYAERQKGIRIHHAVAVSPSPSPETLPVVQGETGGPVTACIDKSSAYIMTRHTACAITNIRTGTSSGLNTKQDLLGVNKQHRFSIPARTHSMAPLYHHRKAKKKASPSSIGLGIFSLLAGTASLVWNIKVDFWHMPNASFTPSLYYSCMLSFILFILLLTLALFLLSSGNRGKHDPKISFTHSLLGILLLLAGMGDMALALFYLMPLAPVIIAGLAVLCILGTELGYIFSFNDFHKHPWVRKHVGQGILFILFGVAGILVAALYFSPLFACLAGAVFAAMAEHGMDVMEPDPAWHKKSRWGK
ncbi:MAG: hypothetical protein ACHQRM_14450 [Bacteroidia bacterium]